jgi:hypothetical protein
MIVVTRCTLSTISVSARPEWFTRSEPAATLLTESWISPLISRAADAARCASVRTSRPSSVM